MTHKSTILQLDRNGMYIDARRSNERLLKRLSTYAAAAAAIACTGVLVSTLWDGDRPTEPAPVQYVTTAEFPTVYDLVQEECGTVNDAAMGRTMELSGLDEQDLGNIALSTEIQVGC